MRTVDGQNEESAERSGAVAGDVGVEHVAVLELVGLADGAHLVGRTRAQNLHQQIFVRTEALDSLVVASEMIFFFLKWAPEPKGFAQNW